jgi:hypothetical protein
MITRIIYCQTKNKSSKSNVLTVAKLPDETNSYGREDSPAPSLLLPKENESVILQGKRYKVQEIIHFPVHYYSTNKDSFKNSSNIEDVLTYMKNELDIELEVRELNPSYGYRSAAEPTQVVLVLMQLFVK